MGVIDFRSSAIATIITTAKHSPAYAALEDLRAQYEIEIESTEGPRSILSLSNVTQTQLLASVKIALPGSASSTGEPSRQPQLRTDHLAQLVSELQQEVRPPTAIELGEMLVDEELAARQVERANPYQRVLASEAGTKIVVATAGVSSVASPIPNDKAAVVSAPSQPQASVAKRPTIVLNLPKKTDRDPSDESRPQKYSLSGSITFTGGMAFLGQQQQITVRQLVDDLTVAEGFANLNEAYYGLDVAALEGDILVEVRDRDGQVLGQGRVNLYDVAQKSSHLAKIQNLAVQIRPVFNGVSGTAISAASYGKARYLVAGAKLFIGGLNREVIKNDKTGAYEDETLAPPSTFLVKSQHKNFWPSLALARSGEPFQMRLFPAGLVAALLELSLDKQQARDASQEGVIWGRVTFAGHPVTGAQVHLIGESEKKPIYFTGFLPDKSKTATSAKGEFAFTRLTEPESILRVSMNGKLFWPTVLPVARRHVSHADLEIEMSRTVEFKSYDAFTAEPRATIFRPLGATEEFMVPEAGSLASKIDTVKGLTLLEADSGEPYTVLRVSVRAGQNEVHLPHLRADWLNKLRPSYGGSAGAKTATVGFIEGDDFEVVLGSGDLIPEKNLVYFDSTGEPLTSKSRESARGRAGGGFVIFDLPQGLHTVTIFPDKSKKVVTQTVYVDEYATHLIRTNLAL
jgi:hypothetical protein